jgi:cell division protease FtsH
LRPLRPRLHRITATIKKHHLTSRPVQITLVAIVLLVVGSIVSVRPTLDNQAPVAPLASSGPTFTYAAGWDLIELQRHIAAGDVVAITKGPMATSAPTFKGGSTQIERLFVRTTTGQVLPLNLSVTNDQALAILRLAGYGDLMTIETTAQPDAIAAAPSSVDLFGRILFMIGLGALLIMGLRWIGNKSAAAAASRPSAATAGKFGVIQPLTDESTEVERAAANTVRLSDVAGCEEAKEELIEVIEFLRDGERFRKMGAKLPRGVLLFGPPGNGKTLMARAVAAEAGVPFYFTSGSDFVEKYVGVGAARVRELFALARKSDGGRAVVFVDEIDAVGAARTGDSHRENDQTLNALLTELDGFNTTDGIVVIGATNRLDVLDPALVRPGRFTRKIHINAPDQRARHEILIVHAKNKPLGEMVDLGALARKTAGFSGADLANLLNEAAIMAARRGGDSIEAGDIQAGWMRTGVGHSRSRSMDERERSIIAAHEAGHALVGRLHGEKRRVELISLRQHGEALGVTASSGEDDLLPSEEELRSRLFALMGGRAAERLLFTSVTAGASDDFDKANHLARQMVTRLGMGGDHYGAPPSATGRGVLSFLTTDGQTRVPDEILMAQTRAIAGLLDQAYAQACQTIVANLELFSATAAYLFDNEEMNGETFDEIMSGKLTVNPKLRRSWRHASALPRDWEDVAAQLPITDFGAVPTPVATPVRAPAKPVPVHGRPAIGRPPRTRRRFGWPRLNGSPAAVVGIVHRATARYLRKRADEADSLS